MAQSSSFMRLAALFLVIATLCSGANTAATAHRSFLLKTLSKYTDALNLKNVSAIPPVSPHVRITNNGNVTGLGQGLVWQTPGSILRLPYRHAVVDPVTGAAIMRATVTNQTLPYGASPAEIANPPPGEWWFYTLRLKVENRLITEIEEIADLMSLTGDNASSLVLADRIWDTVIPPEQRATRDELIKTTNEYWDTVGSILPWPQAPFHPECQRAENGGFTTNSVFGPLSCATEFTSPALAGGTVFNRRIYAVDPIRGTTAGVAVLGGPNSTYGTTVLEEFKIQDGLLRYIEAFFVVAGDGLGPQQWSGWGTGPGSSQSAPLNG